MQNRPPTIACHWTTAVTAGTHPWRLLAVTAQGRRARNEDTVALWPSLGACALADGMGGVAGGAMASQTAVAAVQQALQTRSAGTAARLSTVVARAHQAVHSAARTAGTPGAGTTLTVAVVAGHRIVFGHVGDSRAYLWYRGRLTQITRDHTAAAEHLHQHGDVALTPPRHILARALGQDGPLKIDTHVRRWQAQHVYLLCSDGLHGALTDAEIAIGLGYDTDPSRQLGHLVDAAHAAGSSDNISAILIRY